jgi:hypothetical protein
MFGLLLAALVPATNARAVGNADTDVKTIEDMLSEAAPGEAQDPEPDPQVLHQMFLDGYEAYSRGRYLEACEALYQFLDRTTADDADHDWASFFYGISLKKAGLSHAAVDTLSNLVTRKPNTKIVIYSLEILEDISRHLPFDREMLIETAVCDESYDFVEGDIADFVNYYQGEYNWERGLFSWGDEHFGSIRKDSYYYNKYLFENALRELYSGGIDAATGLLEQVLSAEATTDSLRNDARKTLARLYYEIGRFEEADFLYRQIDMNIIEQAGNLLERAWVHYRMGNPERAMGLLYSFEAPSFENSFTPEFYILKSFIYKDVCHYGKAMSVLTQFDHRYGEAISRVYDRKDARENEGLLLVILNKPRIKRIWNFLSLLEAEQRLAAEKITDEGFSAYLAGLYRLKQDEYERRLRQAVEGVYEAMANELLQFEEEAHLMEYEIGLDMYQRVSEFHYAEDGQSEETSKTGVAVYEFQGEFWNDELDQYSVSLPDKCQDAEEWDIFFK